MDIPYCEICGENHVTCSMLDVGACDDCAESLLREAIAPIMGDVCANISRRSNGFLTVCLAPKGVEHLHD